MTSMNVYSKDFPATVREAVERLGITGPVVVEDLGTVYRYFKLLAELEGFKRGNR